MPIGGYRGDSGLRLGLARIRSEDAIAQDSDVRESRSARGHDWPRSSLWHRRMGARLLSAI